MWLQSWRTRPAPEDFASAFRRTAPSTGGGMKAGCVSRQMCKIQNMPASMDPPLPWRLVGQRDGKEPNPDHLERWLPPDQNFLDDWLARSTELVDDYHPDFMYFDWWIGQPAFQPDLQQFAAYYYDSAAARRQPVVLTYKGESMPANVATLDLERGKMDQLRLLPWQTDTSISIKSWGYVEHDEYRDPKSLIDELVDVVSKNGNLLLNVGPKADGTIPEEARSVLLQMGEWLQTNGEAIYGSRPWVLYGEGPTLVTTGKDAETVLHRGRHPLYHSWRNTLRHRARLAGKRAAAGAYPLARNTLSAWADMQCGTARRPAGNFISSGRRWPAFIHAIYTA